MGMRFNRRIKILPGIRLNVGLGGVTGVSVGPRGASVSVGKRGTHMNLGTPIPGVSLRTRVDGGGRGTVARPRGGAVHAQGVSELDEWVGVSVSPSLDPEGNIVFRSSGGRDAPAEVAKQAWKHNAGPLGSWITEQVAELNAERLAIVRIHERTPTALEYVEVTDHSDAPVPARIADPDLPAEKAPGCLGLFQLLLPPLRRKWRAQRDLEAEALVVAHRVAVERAETRHRLAMDALIAAKEEAEGVAARRRWAWESRAGDPTAMAEVLEEQLALIDWPRETWVAFEIVGATLWLDGDLPEIEDLPAQEAIAASKGVRFKALSATAARQDYMTHVHGIGFLLVGIAFASLPSIQEVVVSGYSQRLNAATGATEDQYLYSARVDRPGWTRIDLAHLGWVDPVEALASFDIKRKMTATGIFKPIEPFQGAS